MSRDILKKKKRFGEETFILTRMRWTVFSAEITFFPEQQGIRKGISPRIWKMRIGGRLILQPIWRGIGARRALNL